MPIPARHDAPPVQVRQQLVEMRLMGMTFDEAWPLALKAVKWPYDTNHRRQWRAALASAEGEFRACYEQRDTRVHANTAALASVLEGREGIDRNDYDLVAA